MPTITPTKPLNISSYPVATMQHAKVIFKKEITPEQFITKMVSKNSKTAGKIYLPISWVGKKVVVIIDE